MPQKFALAGKKLLLQRLIENKESLFGKFDETNGITKESRNRVWSQIHFEFFSLGYPIGKDGKYLRDTTFFNLKKRTLEKKMRREKSGEGSDAKYQYDEVDELMPDLLGRDSPMLEGLGMPESDPLQENQRPKTRETQRTLRERMTEHRFDVRHGDEEMVVSHYCI